MTQEETYDTFDLVWNEDIRELFHLAMECSVPLVEDEEGDFIPVFFYWNSKGKRNLGDMMVGGKSLDAIDAMAQRMVDHAKDLVRYAVLIGMRIDGDEAILLKLAHKNRPYSVYVTLKYDLVEGEFTPMGSSEIMKYMENDLYQSDE